MNAADAIRLAVILDRIQDLSKAIGKVIVPEVGQRFIRLVTYHNEAALTGAYVHAFVDSTNGDLIKAAGWKAPQKGVNGLAVRFNLLDDESFALCLSKAQASSAYLYAR